MKTLAQSRHAQFAAFPFSQKIQPMNFFCPVGLLSKIRTAASSWPTASPSYSPTESQLLIFS
jgi:hypothetical protein